MNRVVVTGTGAVSAFGNGTDAFWSGVSTGTSAIRPLSGSYVAPIRFNNGAEYADYVPEQHLDPKDLSFMERFAQFAMIAAREAVARSGIEFTQEIRESGAVITGSCLGGRPIEETGYWELFHNGKNRVHPFTIPLSMANAGASHICMAFGLEGPSYTVSTACASSTHAIGQAFWMVRSGAAPVAIAGGSEAPFFLGNLKAWEAMRVISKDTCRPFSAERSGMVLGEGAAMLVLETLSLIHI